MIPSHAQGVGQGVGYLVFDVYTESSERIEGCCGLSSARSTAPFTVASRHIKLRERATPCIPLGLEIAPGAVLQNPLRNGQHHQRNREVKMPSFYLYMHSTRSLGTRLGPETTRCALFFRSLLTRWLAKAMPTAVRLNPDSWECSKWSLTRGPTASDSESSSGKRGGRGDRSSRGEGVQSAKESSVGGGVIMHGEECRAGTPDPPPTGGGEAWGTWLENW